MSDPRRDGERGGEHAANEAAKPFMSIYGATERLRTGVNSFLDNTIQPSAKHDQDAGVTARHKDAEHHNTGPGSHFFGHSGSTEVPSTAHTTGTTVHSTPPTTGTTVHSTAPTTYTPMTTSSTTTPMTTESHATGQPVAGTAHTTTVPTTSTTRTGEAGGTGFSNDAKVLGDTIKNAFQRK